MQKRMRAGPFFALERRSIEPTRTMTKARIVTYAMMEKGALKLNAAGFHQSFRSSSRTRTIFRPCQGTSPREATFRTSARLVMVVFGRSLPGLHYPLGDGDERE